MWAGRGEEEAATPLAIDAATRVTAGLAAGEVACMRFDRLPFADCFRRSNMSRQHSPGSRILY